MENVALSVRSKETQQSLSSLSTNPQVAAPAPHWKDVAAELEKYLVLQIRDI